MHTNSKILLLTIIAIGWLPTADAKVNVFACEPEWAALAKELAPDAQIYSATTARQDAHQVQARPSLIAKMRRADILVCSGADLEIGWLPMLQMKSANPKVRSTDKGLFYAADQVQTLDQMTKADRTQGDVHAAGNPHIHLDHERLLKVAKALTNKFSQIDVENGHLYQQQLINFEKRWLKAATKWRQKALPLKGKKVIAYHSNFRYLFAWLGIEQVADLEPKPGIPPSSGHLAKLLKRTQKGDVKAIIYAAYQDSRGANWLAKRAKLPVIELPYTVGGNEQAKDLFSLYDDTLTRLLAEVAKHDT